MALESRTETQDSLIQEVITIHSSGLWAQAAVKYQKLLEIFPNQALLLTAYGMLKLQQGDLQQGLNLLDKSLVIDSFQINVYCNRGIALASLKRYSDAIGSFDKAISLNSDYKDAYYNKGLVLQQLNLYDAALQNFAIALSIDPLFHQAHFSYANTLLVQENNVLAIKYYDQAIALNSTNALIFNNRGNAFVKLQQFKQAILNYDQAILLKPDYAVAYHNRAMARKELQQYVAALIDYQQAIALNPKNAASYNDRGIVLQALAEYHAAIASFDCAISLRIDYAEAYFNRAKVLNIIGQFEQAIFSYAAAIACKPNFAEAYCNQGNVFHELKQNDLALACFTKAIALKPDFVQAHNNLGNLLKDLGRPAEALQSYAVAISLKPDFAEAYYNQGQAQFDLEQYQAAGFSYDTAIALAPDFTLAYWNNALLKMLIGDYENGWKLYEWRWKNPAISKKPEYTAENYWLGEQSLNGKTILIRQEQGLGDFIHFCRYVHLLASLAEQVIIETPPELLSIMSTLVGNFTLIEQGQTLPAFDLYCSLMSLPLVFKTNLQTIPAQVPYLFVDPAKQKCWSIRLQNQKTPRIGLVWAGCASHSNDKNRSMAIENLAPLLEMPATFYVLQKQINPQDLNFLSCFENVYSCPDQLHDFSDTAALLNEMDLVISVDTSVAHLAGALAKPVWILIPYVPDFRWMLNRTDTPWYPTALLFRQSRAGDWQAVIEKVIQRLASELHLLKKISLLKP